MWLPYHAGRWERRYPVQLLELGAALVLLAGSATLLVVGTPRGTIFAFALDRLRRLPVSPSTRCGNGRPTS